VSAVGPAITIRPATTADLPALADLMAASPLLRRYRTTAESARAALERGLGLGDLLLLALPAEDPPGALPAGLAWVIESRILTGAAYLRVLLVAEGRHGGGLGSALLAAAEASARAWANHLVLLATTDNAGARRFYERHGYRHVGDLPGLAARDLDEALYWKPLRPHAERRPV
jgi:ribosomal protein S18 acetylase RimI-like enzyme